MEEVLRAEIITAHQPIPYLVYFLHEGAEALIL